MSRFSLIILTIASVVFMGCSGGGSDTTTETESTELSNPVTGNFIDSAVSGVDYLCSSGNSGVTNSSGEFTCEDGDSVKFSIGSVVLGEVVVQDTISPYTLFPDNDDAAINLAQLLQTIDSDGNPDNGITPDSAMVEQLSNQNIDFTSDSFDAEISSALNVTIVSEEDALQHLDSTLAELGIEEESSDNNGTVSEDSSDDENETVPVVVDVTAPLFTSESSVSVNENSTFVLSLTTDETATLSIEDGADGSLFELNGNALSFKEAKDFESDLLSYSVSIKATDSSSNFSSVTLSVTVNNVSDVTPTLANTTLTVSENSAAETSVGTLDISDSGDSDITEITLSGTGATLFDIANNGEITVASSNSLDYETLSSYTLEGVATNDAGESSSVTVTINILNIEAIAVLADTTVSVEENSSEGTSVGDLIITNAGDGPIETIVLTGTGNENFSVAEDGSITVANGASLNYEETESYNLFAKATNNLGDSATVSLIINVTDIADVLAELSDSTASVVENSAEGTSVGQATVADSGDSAITSFSLTGIGSELFDIDSSGAITVASGVTIDYEAAASYIVKVTATNGAGESESADITVSIVDIPRIMTNEIYSPAVQFTLDAKSAIDGDYMVVNEAADNSVYVYKINTDNTSYTQIQQITTTSGGFGNSIYMQGDYIVVGAFEDDTNATDSGAAYIYKNNGSDTFVELQKLTPSANASDNFGSSVYMDGNYVVVGAVGENTQSGAVYIFKNSGSDSFTQLQRVVSTDISTGDNFGVSVAIDGEYLVVGANGVGADNKGAGYLFKNSSDTFTQVAKLEHSESLTHDGVGYDVDIDGDYIVLGSIGDIVTTIEYGPGDDILTYEYWAGEAIYLFKKDANETITQLSKIQASDYSGVRNADSGAGREVFDYFGNSVAIDENNIVVGAYKDDTTVKDAGAVYIFKNDGSDNFSEYKSITNGGLYNYYGNDVSMGQTKVIVSANPREDTKMAYIFDLEADNRVYYVNYQSSLEFAGARSINSVLQTLTINTIDDGVVTFHTTDADYASFEVNGDKELINNVQLNAGTYSFNLVITKSGIEYIYPISVVISAEGGE